MNQENNPMLQGVNIFDEKLVNKTGLGCGVDITQTIGEGNCKTQILDFRLLKNVEAVEIDTRRELDKFNLTGEDYTHMTNQLNSSLVGKIGATVLKMAFGRELNASFNRDMAQTDDYEYGVSMIILKNYALNIKPALYSSLRNLIGALAWKEINATDEDDRTNKVKIKDLFKKYGTHVAAYP